MKPKPYVRLQGLQLKVYERFFVPLLRSLGMPAQPTLLFTTVLACQALKPKRLAPVEDSGLRARI